MDLLITFVAIMKHGSYTDASQEIFISQSAVSKRIDKLQEALGVRLFFNQNRKMIPTPQAYELLPYARNLISSYQNMKDAMNITIHQPSLVHIGTSTFVTMNYLVPLIQFFKKKQFNFDINYQQIEHKDIGHYLGCCLLDLVLSVKNIAEEPEAECINLWCEHFSCIVHPEHPLANEKEVTLSQLFSYPAVLTETGFPIRDRLENLGYKIGSKLSIRAISSSFLVLQQLVREGVGWTILPDPLCSSDLKKIHCEGLFRTVPVCLYFLKERKKSQTIATLYQSLMEWPKYIEKNLCIYMRETNNQ